MNKDLLTALEVADILKVKKTTVYEMIKRGEIPARKFGKQLRIAAADLEALLRHPVTEPEPAVQPSRQMPAEPPQQQIPLQPRDGLIFCGQDEALDVIAAAFTRSVGQVVSRSPVCSYEGLVHLYRGEADVAAVHLWDEKSGLYNLPYAERMLPGMNASVVRMFARTVGFIVRRGNPKDIRGWEDLGRRNIRICNREAGSGMRVLLDEKLKKMRIPRESVAGYAYGVLSQNEAAQAVMCGEADIGMGAEPVQPLLRELSYIPLQKEWYDAVIPENGLKTPGCRMFLDFISTGEFEEALQKTGQYDFSQTGRITRI